MASMIWLLPEPLSPTTAIACPAAIARSTPFTAWTVPSPVRKDTVRSRT